MLAAERYEVNRDDVSRGAGTHSRRAAAVSKRVGERQVIEVIAEDRNDEVSPLA